MFPWKIEKELSPQERVIRDKLAEIERRGEGASAVENQPAFKKPLLPVSRGLVSGSNFGGRQGGQGLSSGMFGSARNEEQSFASGAAGRPGERQQQQQRGNSLSSNFASNWEQGMTARDSGRDERFRGGPGPSPGATRNSREAPSSRNQPLTNQGNANRSDNSQQVNQAGGAGSGRPMNRTPTAGGQATLGQKNTALLPSQNLQNSAAEKETKLSEKDEKDLKEAIDVMCTVHVRFIELSTREDAIRRLFVPFGPVIGLKVQQDPKPDEYGKMTKFAHVRFVVPEAASLAIEQTNNTKLEGSTIRVTRPTVDTKGPRLQPIIVKLLAEAMQCHRVYVSSIDASVKEDELKSLFAKFGKVLSCSLAQDPNDRHRHRGFGYIEFDTLKAKDAAMMSMNNYNLSGKQLRVGMAVTPPRISDMCLPPPKKSAADYVKEFQSGAYVPVEQPQKSQQQSQRSQQRSQQQSQQRSQHQSQRSQQSQSASRTDRGHGARQQTTDRTPVANYSGLLPSADAISSMNFEDIIRLTSELLGPDVCPRLDGINDDSNNPSAAAGSSYVPAAQTEITSVADEYRELQAMAMGVRFLPNRLGVFDQVGINTDALAVDDDLHMLSSLTTGGGPITAVTELSQRDLALWERALRVNVGIMSIQDLLLAGVLKVFQQIPPSRATKFVGEGLVAMVDSVADCMRSSARMLQNVIFARRDAYIDGSRSLSKESQAELRGLPVQGSYLFNGELARIISHNKQTRGRLPTSAQPDRRIVERRLEEQQGATWRGGDGIALGQGDGRMGQGVRRDRSPVRRSPPRNWRRSRSPPGRMAPRSRSPQRMAGRSFSTRDGRY